MNQKSGLAAGLLLLLCASGASAQLLREGPAERPAVQALKLGLRVFDQPDLVASYERSLAPQWSLLGSLGYFPQYYTSYSGPAAGQIYPVSIQGLNTFYNADAQLRYYFRRKRAHSLLTGFYAAFVLHGAYVRTRQQYEATPATPAYTTRTATTRLQPQLHLGRQWPLGKRLVLDTFVGTEVLRRAVVSRTGRNQYQPANLGLGLQLGVTW